MHDDQGIPIWFFIGALLTVYGILILSLGVYHVFNPPAHKVVLWNLHADIWWSALLMVIGIVFCVKTWPRKA